MSKEAGLSSRSEKLMRSKSSPWNKFEKDLKQMKNIQGPNWVSWEKIPIEGPRWISIKWSKVDIKSNTNPLPKLPLKWSRTPPQPKTSSKSKARKRKDTKTKRKAPKPITGEWELKQRAKCNSKTWQTQKQVKAQTMLNNVTKIPILRN